MNIKFINMSDIHWLMIRTGHGGHLQDLVNYFIAMI